MRSLRIEFGSVQQPFFSDEAIERIIATAGGLPRRDCRGELTNRLEESATWFAHQRLWQQRPSPSYVAKQSHSIERAAQRLLTALGVARGRELGREISPAVLYPLRRAAERMGKRIGGYNEFPPRAWEMEGEANEDFRGADKF